MKPSEVYKRFMSQLARTCEVRGSGCKAPERALSSQLARTCEVRGPNNLSIC